MNDGVLNLVALLAGLALVGIGIALRFAYGSIVPYARDPAAQVLKPPPAMVAVLMKFVLASRLCIALGLVLLGAAVFAGAGLPPPPAAVHVPLTLCYAAPLGVLLVILSYNVLRHRVLAVIETGNDKTPTSERISRVHANFTEYVPAGLLLLGLLEWTGAPALLLHIGGTLLVLGRFLHAWGYSHHAVVSFGRIVGIQTTLLALCYLALACVYYVLSA